MEIIHKHHIVPKHSGGTDDPSNIIELSVEEHAEAHRKLYEEHGKTEDYLAWKGLAGMVSKKELMGNLNSSPEGRARVSKQWKGVPKTPESNQKRRETWAKKYAEGYVGGMSGKQMSEEAKAKISSTKKAKLKK